MELKIDFVFSYLVLQHVLNERVVLNYVRESARVLRPGGIAFMQFRTYTPDNIANQSILTKIKAWIPIPIKQQIKKVLFNKEENPAAIKGPFVSLEEQLRQNYAVWRRCKVNAFAVNEVAKSCNLDMVNVSGLNTQYTYYTFRKVD